MRVLIAGGTGFIGGALRTLLAAGGHRAVVLTRGASGPDSVHWDGTRPGEWTNALEEADAVVNLAGENIAAGRWTARRKLVLRESRLKPTEALAAGIAAARRKPATLVNASAVGYYGDRGDEELPESASNGAGFLAELCRDWEAAALKVRDHGVRVVCLRTGIVLGAGGGALSKMLPPFRLGLGGRLGSGRQWMPWIALDDAAALIVHALTSSLSGPVNIVAPNPSRNADFASALGRSLHRPAVLPAPGFALKVALGEMSEMLLGGQRALPEAAGRSGYRFVHPELEGALRAALR